MIFEKSEFSHLFLEVCQLLMLEVINKLSVNAHVTLNSIQLAPASANLLDDKHNR